MSNVDMTTKTLKAWQSSIPHMYIESELEKIKEKIAHDQEKMNKLSGDVNAITTESQMVIVIYN